MNNSLHSVFGVRKISKGIREKLKEEEFLGEFRLKENNIRELAVKVDKNIDLISSAKIIFDDKYEIRKERIIDMMKVLEEKYDLIFIDTSSDTKYKNLTKTLIDISNKVICITEGNIISIQKTKRILSEMEIEDEKLQIVYNKKNEYTVKQKTLKFLLMKNKNIGILHYDNSYNQIINKNVNSLYINRKIKKEFKQIIKEI